MKNKGSFLNFLFWMLVFGFAVRCFEWALLSHYQNQTWSQMSLCLRGFCYDILFFGKVSLLLFPIHWLISRKSEKAAAMTFRILGAVMLLISNAMIMYYVSADIPLDNVFFTYSIKVLVYISKSTGAFVWWGYVGLLLIPALFFLVSKKEVRLGKPGLFIWLGLAAVSLFVYRVPSWMYDTKEEMNTIGNKQEFFLKSLFKRQQSFTRINPEDLDQQRIEAFQSYFPDVEFVDYRYPLCHLDHTPDVLSGFFDLKKDTLPNIVVIITEGLGRGFSGADSRLPSATPFLDSLSNTGLYWSNCMSSSQRTFAVLPTLLGDLPFGKDGFMQSTNAPRFQSLVSILHENGYNSAFFYGGWVCFDDMCYFLRDMGIKEYLPDHNEYPEEEQNTWGLYDHVMFREALKQVATNTAMPRLDIYLTLTTHDPFEYPDKEKYTQRYVDLLINRGIKQSIPEYLHGRYASYMYYDDCLRKFFADYRQIPGYENTIFIITGDHDFNSLASDLQKCHVPLLVWSPMLKESRQFPALVTHRDVAPSLVSMMIHKYGIKASKLVNWLNTGLDTASYFRAKSFTPQMNASHELTNMVYHDWFLVGEDVYHFELHDNQLAIEPSDSDTILALMAEYKAIDDYVMNNDALLPLDESKQLTIERVDENRSVSHAITATGTYPIDTLGAKNVFKLKEQFPYRVFKLPLDEKLQTVVVYCDCDLYIPSSTSYKCISFGIAVVHADGSRFNLKIATINQEKYPYYDQWNHFSMTQSINKSSIAYQPGDVLIGYFIDMDEHEFYLKDLTLKIVGVME